MRKNGEMVRGYEVGERRDGETVKVEDRGLRQWEKGGGDSEKRGRDSEKR